VGAQEVAVLCDQSLTIEGTETPVVLGIVMPYAGINPGRLARNYAPLLNHLQTRLATEAGARVLFALQVYDSQSNAVEGLLRGQVDVFRPDPAGYARMREHETNLTLLAQQAWHGEPALRAAIFTRQDTGIDRLEDLRGRSFAFGEPESAIGDHVPKAVLVDAGLRARDFKLITNTHAAAVVRLVREGRFDAGVADLHSLQRFLQVGVPLRIILEVRSPSYPWVVRAKFDPPLAAALRERLLALRDTTILTALDYELTGFLPARPSDHDELARQMARASLFDAPP
jgi:phosphonate transport system substrate-binding protein